MENQKHWWNTPEGIEWLSAQAEIEQMFLASQPERAAFEAWAASIGLSITGKYAESIDVLCAESAFRASYQAGQAAMQVQDHSNCQERETDKLFCDLKTDEEKAAFFLSGRGYETGVIAHSIQNDVAMAYHRCTEYKKELEALRDERDTLAAEAQEQARLLGISAERELRLKAERYALREALEMMVEMVEMNGFGRNYVMDVARAALAQGDGRNQTTS